MARVRKSALAYDAITLEGSLISPAKLGEVTERKASEQTEADYLIPKGLTLRDETARYFRIGQALFRELFASAHPSERATIRFTQQLLRDVFGFADIQSVTEPKVHENRSYPLSFEALEGRVPVVVVSPADALDAPSQHLSQDRRRSAATALQDWLNAEDAALWGLCCNGERLRLLRDNESLTRPAYIEANLRQLFEAEDYAGFSALWLILHVSRFGRPATPVTDCALERWREAGAKEGLAARERLSTGVREALLALGNGFLAHPDNAVLREQLTQGQWPIPQFFQELLRLVYRLIFLLAAEDRELLHTPDAPASVCKLYADGYSLGALRDRAIRRSGWDNFHDRWDGLRIVFRSLAHGEPRLGLPALGGLFQQDATPVLDHARLSNRALMQAIFHLAWLRVDSTIVPVNWRDMETEELGSVYEGLLELTPRLKDDGRAFAFAEGLETKGNERKKTGSYYTPDSLVQALLDSALDPVLDRVESEAEDTPSALLGVTVIDPACGSGHFLLAAARRIATRLARARTEGVPSAADYRHALRDVVRCCIHGVDRNPMAIELAQVALWIETVEPGKPLGFLDANLRVGDSLLGIFDLKALETGIPDAAYKALTGDDKTTAKDFERRNKSEKGQATRLLDFSGTGGRAIALPPLAQSLRSVRELPEDTVEEIQAKREHLSSARRDPHLYNLKQAADLYIAAFLTPKTKEQSVDLRTSVVPTTEDVWTAVRGGTVYGPRLGEATKLATSARTFHWPLEFPDVMAKGGFDVVLGNPPWERIKLQEKEFFAAREPEIAEAPNAAARRRMIRKLESADRGTRERMLFEEFELAKRLAESSSEFARLKGENQGRFPFTGRGDVNTYALFAELFAILTSERGRAGVIVPMGIATDATTALFFGEMVSKSRLVSLRSFENEEFIFPSVHHAFRFSLLTLVKRGHAAASYSFFLREPNQLNDPIRCFQLTPKEIARINPNTYTAPIFRSREDARLSAKIQSQVPILWDENSREQSNPWGISFMRMFDMANDSGLFRTADQLLAVGCEREGSNWRSPNHELFVPLYEPKLIHQFTHRWATYDGDEVRNLLPQELESQACEAVPRYWIASSAVTERLRNRGWARGWLIGWRDITGIEKVRTLIASTVPAAGWGNKFLLLFSSASPRFAAALYGCLNSLVCDYCARQKVGSTGFGYFTMKQIPVLPPTAYSEVALSFINPRILELTYTSYSMESLAQDLGYDGPPFRWNEERRALLRAELDAWYARAYGLTRDELRYVLDPADVMGSGYPSETFRVLKNNEIRKYGEYRTQRLVLEAWDRMERGELPCPQPYQAPPKVAAPQDLLGQNPLLGTGPLFESIEVAPIKPATYVAPSTLPDGAWTMLNYNNVSIQLQLAAILKKLPGATSAEKVRLAALYALRPDYLMPHLSGSDLSDWQRLVGNDARNSGTTKVIQFVPRVSVEWRDAYTQLRGMHALIEDSTNDTWAPGSTVQDLFTEGWPDGRAEFAWKAVEGMSIEDSIAVLPANVQAWVKGHAA